MDLDLNTIIAGLFFGLIGYSAWSYGRKSQSGRHMILGVVLMAYGYFVPQLWLALLIGGILTGLLFWP